MTSCAECGANTLASRNITLLIDTVSPPWLTGVALRLVSFRSGSAWLGRSQKGGLPSCRGDRIRFPRPSARARGGSARLPLSVEERAAQPLGRAAFITPQAFA